jgi:hypothetical protein
MRSASTRRDTRHDPVVTVDRGWNSRSTAVSLRGTSIAVGRPMLLRLFSIGVVAFASAACGPSNQSPPVEAPMETSGAADADWTLEIGYGETAFAPMKDGGHVSSVKGSQGGHHVPVTARLDGPGVRGMAATTGAYPMIEIQVVVDGVLQSRSVDMMRATSATETQADFTYLRGYLNGDVHGDATISMKVKAADGSKWAGAERHVVID